VFRPAPLGIRMIRLLPRTLCLAAVLALAGCGFHLRRSGALPAPMAQRVYLQVNGGGEFPRSLAAALRASKIEVLDSPATGVATLSVPVAAFSSRLLTSTGFQRVGEYMVGFQVQFQLLDADGKIVVPMQTINLSHEFAIDQTQFSAIASETEAIERSLVREMTDAVMRRLEARAAHPDATVPASGGSTG
ncbi:MAG: LPS assembly lipoprotein LptE, partial [Rhodanobacteraceae bacterium]